MPVINPTIDARLYTHLLGSANNYIQVTSEGYSGTFPIQVVSGSAVFGDATPVYCDIEVMYNTSGIGLGLPYQVKATRYLVEFNTEIIDRVPSSAIFSWYSLDSSNDTDVVCVETEFENNGVIDQNKDWDGHNESNPVAYTEAISGSDINSGYVNFNFTQAGLNALHNRDYFQMVCMDAKYDYTRTLPPDGTNTKTDLTQDEEGGIGIYESLQPKLTYQLRSPEKISNGRFTIKGGKVTIK